MKQIAILTGAIFAFFLVACSKSDEGGASNKNPIITGKASNVTFQSATIECFVNAESFSKIGVVISPENSNPTVDGGKCLSYTTNNLVGNKFLIELDVLKANTTYYYRAYYYANGVNNYGDTKSFTTKEFPCRLNIQALVINACDITIKGDISNFPSNAGRTNIVLYGNYKGASVYNTFNYQPYKGFSCYKSNAIQNNSFTETITYRNDGTGLLPLVPESPYEIHAELVMGKNVINSNTLNIKTTQLFKQFKVSGVSVRDGIATISYQIDWYNKGYPDGVYIGLRTTISELGEGDVPIHIVDIGGTPTQYKINNAATKKLSIKLSASPIGLSYVFDAPEYVVVII